MSLNEYFTVRTDRDSLIFQPGIQALAKKTGSVIVKMHDHDDGTACAIVGGGLARHLASKIEMSPATLDELREAGIVS